MRVRGAARSDATGGGGGTAETEKFPKVSRKPLGGKLLGKHYASKINGLREARRFPGCPL
jgi:hypothetical protein